MAITIKCPTCFYYRAIQENESTAPGTPEYLLGIYCPSCESGEANSKIKDTE